MSAEPRGPVGDTNNGNINLESYGNVTAWRGSGRSYVAVPRQLGTRSVPRSRELVDRRFGDEPIGRWCSYLRRCLPLGLGC